MQPLDVSIFQPYKHWHDKAIKYTMRHFEAIYDLQAFLFDLPAIRDITFKPSTIMSGFKKASLWPINIRCVLDQMRIYNPLELPSQIVLLKESRLPCTPQHSSHAQKQIGEWKERIPILLSSPSARKFESFVQGTEVILNDISIVEHEVNELCAMAQESRRKKTNCCKVIQKGGKISVHKARQKKEARE